MRRSSFLLLLLLTLACGLGALALMLVQQREAPVEAAGGPAFPLLAEAPAEAARIEVTSAKGSYLLARSGAAALWLLPDKGGYPADGAAVTRLLAGLAGLRLFEAKTAKAERLALLGLAGPEAGADQGSRLVVLDAQGRRLADAVIGGPRANIDAEGGGGTYLRYWGSDQAWLAAGEVTLPADVEGLLDRQLATLPGSVIARITITPPDGGPPLVVERAERGGLGLALVPPTEDGQTVDGFALRQMADTLEHLSFRDVRPAEALPLPEAWRAEFLSFDGIAVTLTFRKLDQELWATLAADAVPPPLEGGAVREDAAKYAAKIAAAAGGWVYRLDPFLYQRLARRRADVLKATGG